MAKNKTTGQPRKERVETIYRSKAERERYYQRLALIGAALLGGLVVIILLGAVLNDLVLVPEQSIVTVNDTDIKTKEFQERYRAERWFMANEVREAVVLSGGNDQLLSALLQGLPPLPPPYQNDPISFLRDDRAFGRYVLENLQREVLLEREAEKRDIKVDEGEIQAQVDEYFERWTGINLTPTVEPSATREVTLTPTPLITSTPTQTATPTELPTGTPLPTATDCAEGEDCPTVTPLPTTEPEATATEILETLTPEPTNTDMPRDQLEATLDNFSDDFYQEADDVANVDREAVRGIFYLRALRSALRDELTQDLPTESVWANSRHILIDARGNDATPPSGEFDPAICETEAWTTARENADQVYAALLDGEPFAALAKAMSDDPGSGAEGGNLGWADVANTYVEPFADAIVNAEIGAFVEPVCSPFGWHIIQVMDREVREIAEFQLEQQKSQEYQTWEQDLLFSANVQLREDWPDRIPDEPTFDELLGNTLGLPPQ